MTDDTLGLSDAEKTLLEPVADAAKPFVSGEAGLFKYFANGIEKVYVPEAGKGITFKMDAGVLKMLVNGGELGDVNIVNGVPVLPT